MLPEKTILKIQKCLMEGLLSNREIALRVGVSRQTVDNVAAGRRRCRSNQSAEYEHCSECGHHVLMPCLACLLKKLPRIPGKRKAPLIMGLDLKPHHHKRYLQIRSEKEKHSCHLTQPNRPPTST